MPNTNAARFHVVAITTKEYIRLASYVGFEDARRDALGRRATSYSIVLRDGTSGKRFSIEELRS